MFIIKMPSNKIQISNIALYIQENSENALKIMKNYVKYKYKEHNNLTGGGLYMKVIKKDRSIQDFDLRKTVLSIERASDDSNESINESDAENIANSITRELNKLGINMIESYKIKDIIIKVLQELGFNGLANIYARGSKQ